jgi:hypothetical protein
MKPVRQRQLLTFALVTLASLHSVRAADQTAIWDDSTNDWSNSAHWSTTLFPNNGNGGFTYDATLNSGTITLDRDITIEKYTQNGGTLTAVNSFTLTLNGNFAWSGGTANGAGILQANGGMSLSGTTKTLNSGRTVNNAGAATWTAGDFNTGGGAMFNNQAGGTFGTNFDGSFDYNQGGTLSQFNNAGTFTKSGGVGTTLFSTGFNNSGTVNVNSGTLSLAGGGTDAGVFAAGGQGRSIFPGARTISTRAARSPGRGSCRWVAAR